MDRQTALLVALGLLAVAGALVAISGWWQLRGPGGRRSGGRYAG